MNNSQNSKPKKNSMPSIQNTIPVFYRNEGKYSFLETYYLGFRITISTKAQPYMGQDGNLYLTYDMNKAVLVNNKNGYPNLFIDI